MKITMIGTGYVGLVSGTCFAEFGFEVTCVDKDQDKIAKLNIGQIPIYEPGLDDWVERNVKAGRLKFTTELKESVAQADAVFIAVGTPMGEDGHADLSYVFAAAEEIAQNLDGYTAIVTKSTVPVGTGAKVREIIRKTRPDADFDVVSNPEFLREGSAIEDFQRPDRVVIGTDSERAFTLMRKLYRPLNRREMTMVETSIETAELIKYASNAFLATKITFINEIADLCEKVGAHVQHVAKGVGLDGRIGPKFLHPGPGYGGSCFPKDTLALVKTGQDHGAPIRIVETVVEVNDQRKKAMTDKVIRVCGGSVEGKTIAVLGVTFKPNTDDMRDSPALDIIPGLEAAGATIKAFDPAGMKVAENLLPHVTWCADAYSTLKQADCVVVITEWHEFRGLDLERMKSLMNSPTVVDLRNVYIPEEMRELGFTYESVGRPDTNPTDAEAERLRIVSG